MFDRKPARQARLFENRADGGGGLLDAGRPAGVAIVGGDEALDVESVRRRHRQGDGVEVVDLARGIGVNQNPQAFVRRRQLRNHPVGRKGGWRVSRQSEAAQDGKQAIIVVVVFMVSRSFL